MKQKRISLLRDAEASFHGCASFLFHGPGKPFYQKQDLALSVDARRLAILLLAQRCFPFLEPKVPLAWEKMAALAASLDKKKKEDLMAHLPPLLKAPDPLGLVDATSLSQMGFFYERMKDFEAKVCGQGLKIGSSRPKKKSRGIYFTPLSVCDFMVRRALRPALDNACNSPSAMLDLRIIDPAMGTGQFLLAAAEVLVSAQTPEEKEEILSLRRKVFDGCLFGIELEEENVDMACFLFGLYMGGSCSIPKGIVQGDALVDSGGEGKVFGEDGFPEKIFSIQGMPFDGFDAILGNPPYVTAKNRSFAKYKPYLGETTQADFYLLFIHKYAAKKYLRPGGALCFLVPDPLLLRANAEGARRRLVEILDLESLLHIKGVFPRTRVANVIFLARKPLEEESRAVQVARLDAASITRSFRNRGEALLKKISREIPKDYFRQAPRKEFRYLLGEKALGVVKTLNTDRPLRPGPGIVVRPLHVLARTKGSIFRGEEIGKDRIRELAVKSPEEGQPMLLGGESVHRYSVRDDGLYLPPDQIKKDRPKYRRHKILLQKSTGRIVAALDEKGYVIPQSVYGILIDDPRIGYPFLLTQLNSRLINYYMHVMFTGYKLVQPQIEIEDIRQIPVLIPQFDETTEVRSSSLETAKTLFVQYIRTDDPGWILEYVDENLKLDSPSGSAMIHDLLDFLGNQSIRAYSDPQGSTLTPGRLEWLIDLVIYKVYRLSLDQIETVESFFGEEEESEGAAEEEGSQEEILGPASDSPLHKPPPLVFGENVDKPSFEAGNGCNL